MNYKTLQQQAFAIVLVAFSMTTSSAFAVVTTGNLFEIQDGVGNDIGSTIDRWYFTVNTGGVITFDTLSWEIDWADVHDNDLDTNEVVDVNGDGEIAFFDPHILLFFDDGNLDALDFITSVDDSGSETFADGSIFGFDSYLSLFLSPGDYVLAISGCCVGINEAIAGFSTNVDYYPASSDGLGNFFDIDHGDYQITWTGDVTITGDPGTGIPEPSSAFLAVFAAIAMSLRATRARRE